MLGGIFNQPPILPSNQNPLGALPARFRRERLLIVGCGDVGLRVARALSAGVRVLALTSSAERVAGLRHRGITPLPGNLDDAASLRRLAGIAHRVLHLAPPPNTNREVKGNAGDPGDPRTRALLAVLRRRTTPARLVYGSTSGVYGDCQGEVATEIRAVNAKSARAEKRVDAEARVRHFGRATGTRVKVLRIPGIYALDRANGTPAARLQKGTPVLRADDDVFTNHIHADDLARACIAALWRGKPLRVYNVNDNTVLKMGDYFDLAADILNLPRPPRVSREMAKEVLSALQLSFMGESRRMDNTRMKRELRLRLLYPTVVEGLVSANQPL